MSSFWRQRRRRSSGVKSRIHSDLDRLGILDRGKLVALGSPQSLKARIGGDVIVLETKETEKLRRQIEDKFRAKPIVIGETVRLEHERGHEFLTHVVETLPPPSQPRRAAPT